MLTIVCRTLVYIRLLLCKSYLNQSSMGTEILEKFGKRVRDERLKQGLSQEQLAEKAGLHRTYIGMIERAEKNITLINIEKVAKALEISVEELLRGIT